jgi:hypothetical protein
MNEEDEAFNELERKLNALRDHPEYYKPIAKHAATQREWVGLTDDEMQQACYEVFSYDPYVIARAIEAKLKEKNT